MLKWGQKAYRGLFEQADKLRSRAFIERLNRNPGVSISKDSYLGPQVEIEVAPGGRLSIQGAYLAPGVRLEVTSSGVLSLGKIYVGFYSRLTATGTLSIEDACQVAEFVKLQQDKFSAETISVAQNVWLASKVEILPGVEVGQHAVVAGSARVEQSLESCSVSVGRPARTIKVFEY